VPFDKSIRLLNFCVEESNRLKLYTSLPHDYVVGDTVFINGGYYDNSKNLVNVSSFAGGTAYNPFSNQLKGYEVLAINYSDNSVVLDIIVDVNNLIYPYGVENNPYGDPQNLIDLAYNTFDNDDLYKHVYISRALFSTGSFRQGIINNGVFGNDHNTVRINRQISSTNTQCVVNHIASKNVLMSSGVIHSKTDSDVAPCLAIKVVEDATVGSPNPFYLDLVGFDANNNGFGFNMFDRFTVTDNANIDNGVLDNPILNGIDITLPTFTGGYIGSDGPIYGLTLNDNISMDGVTLRSSTMISTHVEIANAQIDTSISLRGISFAYTANESEFILNVNYETVANKKWDINTFYYIQGFRFLDNNTYFPFNQAEMWAKLTDVSYTFGDITSATMTFDTDIEYIIDWAVMMSTYAANDIDCSDVILYPRLTITPKHIIPNTYINQSTLRTLYDNTLGTMFVSNTNISGIHIGTMFDGYCTLNGTHAGLSTRLAKFIQVHDAITESATALDGQYVTIEYKTPIKANFINSEIREGWIYDSFIRDTHVYGSTNSVYLNNLKLQDGSKVDSGVFWNDAQVNFTGTDIGGLSGFDLIETAYLGDRKTPWITGLAGIAPLNSTQGATNINKIEGNRAAGYYTSQAQTTLQTLFPVNNNTINYEVPTLYNVITSINTSKQIAILDYKTMTYNGVIWQSGIVKPRIMYGSVIALNFTLQLALQRKFANTLAGIYTLPGVDPSIATTSQITRVDDNFLVTQNLYGYPTEARTQREMTIYVKDLISPMSNAVPDPVNNNPNVLFFAKVTPNVGPSYDNILTGSTTAIANGINKLKFRHNGVFAATVGNATDVPACFIEIERIIITEKDLLDVITNRNIVISNYCVPSPTAVGDTRYSFDTTVALNTYPTDFVIKDNADVDVTINMDSTKKIDVIIEYWVTWYYKSATYAVTNLGNSNLLTGHSGGVRTKHTLNLAFESNNETYYLITATGNNRITSSAGDPLVYELP